MPETMSFASGKADQALAASTIGQFLRSAGPVQVPVTSDTFTIPITHQGTVDYRIPAGGMALNVWASNTTFPYNKAAGIGAVGNIFTGAWLLVSQTRGDDGGSIGIGEANYFSSASVEGSMVNIWPDVAAPGLKIQSNGGNPGIGGQSATCTAFYNADDLDPNFFPSAYAGQTGKKQSVTWGDGRIDWGPNLGLNPQANRQASLYRDASTNLLTMTAVSGVQLPGIKLFSGFQAGDGAIPNFIMGDVSPSLAAYFRRKLPAQDIFFGDAGDTGRVVFQGRGGFLVSAQIPSGAAYGAIQNYVSTATYNMARLYFAPHSGYTFPDNAPYIEAFSVPQDSGLRLATYYSGGPTVRLTINPDGTFLHNGAAIGFFGGPGHAQYAGGVATAGGTYGATEQTMLQILWNMSRGYSLLT